jgi:hypothetical protein
MPPRMTMYRLLIMLALLPAALLAVLAFNKGYRHRSASRRLDFKLVEERCANIGYGMRREQIEAILGPPSERNVWDPELKEIAEQRNRAPKVQAWDRWSDPKNRGRWLAILYAGDTRADAFYWIIKRGF